MVDLKGFAIDPTPPLGLAYIAGALAHAGYAISVLDAIGESPRQFNSLEFTPYLKEGVKQERMNTNGLSTSQIISRIPNDADIIGFSCMFSNNWLSDRHLISVIREEFPKALIIAGGESISAKPELWMHQSPGLDFCIHGEGEETVVELVETLEKKGNVADVAGISFRDGATIVHTAKRTRIKHIDQIPPPAWVFFPVSNYLNFKLQYSVSEKKTFPIMTTRGCPYSCTFCSSPQMWGTRYYMRDTSLVVDEIESLVKNYGIDNIDLYDLTAIIKKDWIIQFAKELINRKINITWNMPAGTRSEVIDEEVIDYLKRSGCRSITYAPESGSPKMLKLIKKKVSLPKMLSSMASANRYGINIYINMILALPEERHRDVLKTIWFICKCSFIGVNEMGLAMFRPYPGSALFEKLLAEKKIDLSTDDFFYDTITISPIEYCRYNYNEYVSSRWYQIYSILAFLLFFAINYTARPLRFVNLIKTVINKNYESRFERTISRIFYTFILRKKEFQKIPSD